MVNFWYWVHSIKCGVLLDSCLWWSANLELAKLVRCCWVENLCLLKLWTQTSSFCCKVPFFLPYFLSSLTAISLFYFWKNELLYCLFPLLFTFLIMFYIMYRCRDIFVWFVHHIVTISCSLQGNLQLNDIRWHICILYLNTMACGLCVQKGKIMVNIMWLVGRNLVHLCHCMDTSVGSIGLDLNFYMSGTNVLDLIL